MTTTNSELAEDTSSWRKTKKPRKAKETAAVETLDAQPKEKKRKRGRKDDKEEPVPLGEVENAELGVLKRKEKRRRRRSVEDEEQRDGDNADTVTQPEHKKEHTRLEAELEVEESVKDLASFPVEESRHREGKKKSRKAKRELPTAETDLASQGAVKEDERKKKRMASKHGFRDPAGDATLSEQASKALAYAYAHSDDTANWKFNKARQNWLIRNIWSEEAIPSDYVSLVARYFIGVQGRAKETLIQTCRGLLEQSATALGTVEDSSHNEATVLPSVKQQRARELLNLVTVGDAS